MCLILHRSNNGTRRLASNKLFFSFFVPHAYFSRTESVVETIIQYFIGTGLLTRLVMFHWSIYRSMIFFSPIVFLPFCVLHWWFFSFCSSMLLFHTLITHYSVRCPAQHTSLFRDGIFDDSTSVFTFLPFFSQVLIPYCAVYANSILAMYGFPLTLMSILTSFPKV